MLICHNLINAIHSDNHHSFISQIFTSIQKAVLCRLVQPNLVVHNQKPDLFCFMEMKGPETTYKQTSYLTHCTQLNPFVLDPPYEQAQLHSWSTGAMKPVLNGKTMEYGKCCPVYKAVGYRVNTSVLPTSLRGLEERHSSLMKNIAILLGMSLCYPKDR